MENEIVFATTWKNLSLVDSASSNEAINHRETELSDQTVRVSQRSQKSSVSCVRDVTESICEVEFHGKYATIHSDESLIAFNTP